MSPSVSCSKALEFWYATRTTVAVLSRRRPVTVYSSTEVRTQDFYNNYRRVQLICVCVFVIKHSGSFLFSRTVHTLAIGISKWCFTHTIIAHYPFLGGMLLATTRTSSVAPSLSECRYSTSLSCCTATQAARCSASAICARTVRPSSPRAW